MSAIFGIFTSESDGALAERMEPFLTAHYSKRGAASIQLFDSAAIGHTDSNGRTSNQIVAKDKQWVLVVYGEITLNNEIPLTPSNFEPEFLQPFLINPSRFCRTLKGSFIFALMSNEETFLVNDPSGNFAIYYAAQDSHFVFSTKILSIRKVITNADLDERGTNEYLGISQPLDGRTIFRHIKKLSRGTIIHYQRGYSKEYKYIGEADRYVQVEQKLEHTYYTLRQSVLRSASGDSPVFALSGGLDTRLTWSILLGEKISNAVAYTHGTPDSRDVLLASQISRRFNIKHDIELFDSSKLRAMTSKWEEFILLTEGQVPLTQIHTLSSSQYLAQQHKVIVDSYGGPLYRRQIKKFIESRIDADKDVASQTLPYEYTPLFRAGILNKDLLVQISQTCLRSLREYYESLTHLSSVGDKFDRFYADQTAALRDSAVANLQMNFLVVRQPLMDQAALESAARIPLSIRKQEGIHKYIINRSFQKLRTISLDYSGYYPPYLGFSTLRLILPAVDLAYKRIFKSTLRRPPIAAKHILEPAWTNARQLLLDFAPTFNTYINRSLLEKEVRTIDQKDYRNATAILQLLTFRMLLDLL